MKEFSIPTLAQIIKAEPAEVAGFLTGVSIDSRTIKAGDCFFAVAGENFDGHDYVADAFAKGAVCAVVADETRGDFVGFKVLRVKDTIVALGDFARKYRRQSGFKVVAITGSNGKTTTKQIAYHVLSRHFRVFRAPKNFNNDIGLPLTLLMAGEKDQIVIAELGSNRSGEISYLTDITQPDIAVVTNVHPAHLEGHGDLQAIMREKLSISEGLREDGVFFINADCEQLVESCRAAGVKFTTFGKTDDSDIRACNITRTGVSASFMIEGIEVFLPLPGLGNIENALAAWAICRQFGVTGEDFADAVRTLPAVHMRAELLQIGTLTVVNDCYNANPVSMKNALDILIELGSANNRRLVFICGDMAELGRQREQLHAEAGAFIARAKVRLLLAVGSLAKIAALAAKETAEYDLQIECFEDVHSVCNNLGEFVKDSDIVLVKGSRLVALELAVEKLKEIFGSSEL